MGLESYLLQIKFHTPVSADSVISLIEEAGMIYLRDRSQTQTEKSYSNLYFEQRTKNGLTEAHVLTSPSEEVVDEFSIRFSILSPNTVIDQTFKFLQQLNNISPIDVYDTEIQNHIMRQLRQSGKVDSNFVGLDVSDEEAISKFCLISLNADDFRKNEFEIMKRKIILNNQEGEIIEGGSATTDFIEKRGLFDKLFGWIKKEI